MIALSCINFKMKKVLILVLSSDFPPYDKMIQTSLETWDTISVDGAESVFYCSQKDNPKWKNSDKIRYFDTGNSLYDMMDKNAEMYQWALLNKEFDYVARINASCYCDKKELIEYVQTLPTENVFVGVEVTDESKGAERWAWGGTQFIFSSDVLQKLVNERHNFRKDIMEDMATSFIINKLGIEYTKGIPSCSIDKTESGWTCISYIGKSVSFTDFSDLKDLGHVFYRVKQDGKREMDEYVMRELFKVLK